MQLAKQQSQAYDAIHKWLSVKDQPMFRLGGFAGTGKSYLLGHLVNNYMGDILCACPTGKAASVLQSKLTTTPVTTIHSLLYTPVPPNEATLENARLLHEADPDNDELHKAYKDEKLKHKKNEISFAFHGGGLRGSSTLIIIDEASMVSETIKNDILSLGVKVLFVGDPGQLPPVNSKDWFNAPGFDYVMTDIHRQALDSPIIRLSMDIRKGRLRPLQFQRDDCRVVSKPQVKVSELIKADQLITGTNAERHKLNRLIRKKLKIDSMSPITGDKLICLKNDRESHDVAFINGVQAVATGDARLAGNLKGFIDIDYDGEMLTNVLFYPWHCLNTYGDGVEAESWKDIWGCQHFDYAYAITCHKAQGSEWDNVVVIDDRMQAQDRNFRKRWLYTAVTRAKNKLTLVR